MNINIVENTFDTMKEAYVDESSHKIHNVVLFGRRRSKNNRIYSDRAISDIAALSEGAPMYINHVTPTEKREFGGIRDLKNFAGTYASIKHVGESVKGTVHVSDQFWPLLKGIAHTQPAGVGCSIDAVVMVRPEKENNMEVIESVNKIRSVDCVSHAATVSGLFSEAIRESKKEFDLQEALNAFLGIKPKANKEEIDEFILKVMGGK